jgi:hypothetical protein
MFRGIVSIIALVMVCSASVVMASIWIFPNMSLFQVVTVLQPLHQAIACEAGETMTYEYVVVMESEEVQFRCVNEAGVERNVDDIIQRPALYALGVFGVGVLLLMGPFLVAMRREFGGERGAALRTMIEQGTPPMQPGSVLTAQSAAPLLSATGQQQLEALDKLRQQNLIAQDAYEIARKRIFDNFASS